MRKTVQTLRFLLAAAGLALAAGCATTPEAVARDYPARPEVRAFIDGLAERHAFDRAALDEIFARDSAYSARIFIKPPKGPGEPGEVLVSGRSAERGDNEGMIDASVEGEPMEVAFNIRYLIDVLSVIQDERVVLESNGAAYPGVLRPENRDDFVHVIMPMSVTR